jgi:hypothetical protein
MPFSNYVRITTLSALLLAANTLPAAAQSPLGSDFVFGGVVESRLKSDQTLNSVNGVKPFNNTFGEIESDLYANFGKYFSINSHLTLEQVRSVDKNSLFRGEGAYVEQLYGTINLDPVRVYGGKIHPHFGRAWDINPGLYGTDFAEDYELVEKNGVGVSLDFNAFGRHTLYAETFFQDTSFLSNSVLSRPKITDPDVIRPKSLNVSDGGVSNTGRLDNFAFALEGTKLGNIDGLGYALGYARQQGSEAGGELDERSYVASINYEIPLGSRMTLTPLFEYVRQLHRQGTDQNAHYFTVGASLALPKGWEINAYGTLRDLSGSATLPNSTDHLLGASVLYDLSATLLADLARRAPWARGFTIEVGYKHELVQSQDLNTVGFELVWGKAF